METNTDKQLPSCKLPSAAAASTQCCSPAGAVALTASRQHHRSFEADEAPCIRDDNCKAGLRCSAGQCVAAAAKKPGAEERRQRSLQAAV